MKLSDRNKPKKDFPGNLIRINFLEEEIRYAQSCLQEHNSGHIYTAINWMQSRIEELKNEG